MSLIDVTPDLTPEATKLAEGDIARGNQVFEELRAKAYDDVQTFWYLNQDEDGNPALEGPKPTGIQRLQAMGTRAKDFWALPTQRALMLINIATELGKPEEVDLAKISAPYDLTFAPDGSLDTYTLR